MDAPGYAAYPGAPLGSLGFGCKHDQIERPAARESKGDEMAQIARSDRTGCACYSTVEEMDRLVEGVAEIAR